MSLAGIILLIYFIGGLFALLVFDLTTHRIRSRFKGKVVESQVVMAQAGNLYIGKRVMLAMFATITYLFWPFVIVGALRGSEKEEQAPEVVTRADMAGAGAGKQLAYWAKRIWYGECPKCGVILTPMDTWGQYSVCPVCKTEFHGIRMKASKTSSVTNEEPKGDQNGTSKARTKGEGGSRLGSTMGHTTSEENGKQSTDPGNTERSKLQGCR